jgi:hypothetical protein
VKGKLPGETEPEDDALDRRSLRSSALLRGSKLLDASRFVLALSSIGVALYFAVGSYLFPDWFFPLLWRGKFWDVEYWKTGIYWLLDNAPYWIVAISIVIAACVAFYALFRDKVQPLINKTWRWALAFCVLSVLVTSVIVYRFEHNLYEMIDATQVTVKEFDSIVRTIGAPPPVDSLTDFHYLNAPRVIGLYDELQPELIEEQRKITASSSVSAKAGIMGGPATAELNAGRDSTSELTLGRPQFAPERKCLEIIRSILEKHPEKYYSQLSRSAMFKSTQELKENWDKVRGEPLNPANLQRFRPLSGKEATQRENQLESAVEGDLKSLAGVVIVDGDFLVARKNATLFLTETFSEKSLAVRFETTVPDGDGFRGLESNHKTRLRVLGTVITSLGPDGKIELRALAVY